MPDTYNMKKDDDLYRAIIQYDIDQTFDAVNRVWVQTPIKIQEIVIGPYTDTRSIKSWITRNRRYRHYKNLRLGRVEKVSAWEEVNI